MGWVTIDGRHVFISNSTTHLTGGGHKGTHNPSLSTGNKVADDAVNASNINNPENAVLKSRLVPAIKTKEGKVLAGDRGDYHSTIARIKNKIYTDYQRGFLDPLTHKYYNYHEIGLDSTDVGARMQFR